MLWGTSMGGNKIYRINPNDTNNVQLFSGGISGNTDGPISSATFSFPNGILFNPIQNSLYVSQIGGVGNGNIRKIENLPLSVNAVKDSNLGLSVYPNPFTDAVTIDFKLTNNKTQMSIYNALGKMVISQIITEPKTINLSNQPNGIYFLVIVNGNRREIKKIIKQ
jgi:hypothetical protein